MKNSWTMTFRRLAAATVVAGTSMYFSAMCYAHSASASATDPVYNDGWQAGDDEGPGGFGPWSFDGTYTSPIQQAMDDGMQSGTQSSSQHNDLGRAWTLFNPMGPEGPSAAGPSESDIARVGRALPGGALHIGDTLSITVDNPTQRANLRGWTIKLLSGGANACFAGDNCSTPAIDPGTVATKLAIGTFEYYSNGIWYDGNGIAPLFDTDTADGVTIDITRTGRQTATVKMSSPGNPTHTENVNFTGWENATGPHGVPDWVMIEFYNTDSDSYPTLLDPRQQTDFYISQMSVTGVPEPGSLSLLVLGVGTLWGVRGARRERP